MKPNESEEVSNRFQQGFKAGQIISPYLVRNFWNGKIEGNPYIIMQFCPQGSLTGKLPEFYPEDKYTRLSLKILQGLDDLHNNGVIHRDLKPDNVLFDEEGEPKLSDFDISGFLNKRMTSRNWIGAVKETWGSLLYVPPEQLDQWQAYKMTRASMDIFAFGVTMYETITQGRLPFGTLAEFEKNPAGYYQNVKSGRYTALHQYRPTSNVGQGIGKNSYR